MRRDSRLLREFGLAPAEQLARLPNLLAGDHFAFNSSGGPLPPERATMRPDSHASTAQRLSISSQYIGGRAQRRAILVERLVGLRDGNVREVGPVLFELPHKVLGVGRFAPEAIVPVVVKPDTRLNENGKVGVAASSLDCARLSAHWVSSHAAPQVLPESETHHP
jgi:hypothetical protein